MNDDMTGSTTDATKELAELRRGRTEAIREFLDKFAPSENDDLLLQMMVTLCRLAADDAARGDLKILNSALKELRYAFKVFEPYKHMPKVTMFGSARTKDDHAQYLEALRFAELIEQQGWMVITGAGGGIMEAGHHGAKREASFGVAISLPFEQSANEIITGDHKLINFKYFFTRKLMFVKEANAIVLFPGGFGTQDEGFEALTLVQTGKSQPVPIVLCDEPGGTYWQHWRTYVKAELLGNSMIDDTDMNLFFVTDSAEKAVAEITAYYRRYHSSRFVNDRLVIRMNSPISDEAVAIVQEQFADIAAEGTFQQSLVPIEGEGNVLADKARLVFQYNRRSAGRLRMLIDFLNRQP